MLAGAHLRGDHSRTIKNGRVGSSLHTSAFVATNPTDEPITSGLSLALIGNASAQKFPGRRAGAGPMRGIVTRNPDRLV